MGMKYKVKKSKLVNLIFELMGQIDRGESMAEILLGMDNPEMEKVADIYFKGVEELDKNLLALGLACVVPIRLARTSEGNTYGNRDPIPVIRAGGSPPIIFEGMDERMQEMFGSYYEITVDVRCWANGQTQIVRRVFGTGSIDSGAPPDDLKYLYDDDEDD